MLLQTVEFTEQTTFPVVADPNMVLGVGRNAQEQSERAVATNGF